MQALDDIFGIWPSTKAMADALGAQPDMVRKWKKFGRIPADSWQTVIEAVRKANGSELTFEQLLAFNAPMRPRGRPPRVRRSRQKKLRAEARA